MQKTSGETVCFFISLSLFVRFLIYYKGYGLKCYQCLSTKSWDDCASNKIEATCSSNQYTCGQFFLDGNAGNISTKFFHTSCAVKSACNQDLCKRTPSQQGIALNKCEVDCCDNDLCNEPKVPGATDECGLHAFGMRSSTYFSL